MPSSVALEKSQVPYTFTPDLQLQEWINGQLSRFFHHNAIQGEIIYRKFFEERFIQICAISIYPFY